MIVISAHKGNIHIKAEGKTFELAEAALLAAWDEQMNDNGTAASIYDECMALAESEGVIFAMRRKGFSIAHF